MNKIIVKFLMSISLLSPWLAKAKAYEIGEELETAAFWKNDPVLFVSRHTQQGFTFTTDARKGADSRLDGAVTWHGQPVYESKIVFGDEGGIERVELMLYTPAGTEGWEVTEANGKQYRKRIRIEKDTLTHEQFGQLLAAVRKDLTSSGAKIPQPQIEKSKTDKSLRQGVQVWPKTEIASQATLTWGYRQIGKKIDTFRAGFVRLTVDGPAKANAARASRGKKAASGSTKISDNVKRESNGDVHLDGVPMVDQGQKGYCAVASAERVLKYFGLSADEHEIAEAAGTSVEYGTSADAMKEAVEAIGKKYRLATMVAYGDVGKTGNERIDGLVNEVKAYNKMAKKLKKPKIEDSVYITHEGNTTMFNPQAVDEAMDPEVRKEMKVNGVQKAKYTKFMADVRQQIDKGIPLFWSVTLGIYPEPGLPQAGGGHMRLIIGYNDKRKELLYSDSWGAGHELKRMPSDWAFAISHGLIYMKPLSR